MKKLNIIIGTNIITSAVTISCFLFTSCGILTTADYNKNFVAPKKIALITTNIGPTFQPTFPLIDAAMFNEGTNAIAPEIVKMQARQVNNIEKLVVANLGTALRCEVVSPEKLRELSNFKEIEATTDLHKPLNTTSEVFTNFILSDKSLFPFQHTNNLLEYLNTNTTYQPVLAKICQSLSVDMLAISYWRLNVVQAGAFGIYGSLRLESQLFLFDKNGKLAAKGFSHSYPTQVEAKDIGDYAEQMGFAETVLKTLLAKFYEKMPVTNIPK